MFLSILKKKIKKVIILTVFQNNHSSAEAWKEKTGQ
jgi:hypothetical protein